MGYALGKCPRCGGPGIYLYLPGEQSCLYCGEHVYLNHTPDTSEPREKKHRQPHPKQRGANHWTRKRRIA